MTDLTNASQIHKVFCRLSSDDKCPILASHAKDLVIVIGAEMGLNYEAPALETKENSCKLTWSNHLKNPSSVFSVEYYKTTEGWTLHRVETNLPWGIPQGQDKIEDIVAFVKTHFPR